MPDYIETCENAARAGGAVLLDWLGRVDPQEKGPRDLVTQADLASQNAIRDIVLGAFPEHGFVGEEAAESHNRLDQAEFCWVVDPLDGTTNFVHGLPNFAVSVALVKGNEILAGAIFDPIMDECYTALAGNGAALNGKPIRASDCVCLEEALVATGFSARVQSGSPEVARFLRVLEACRAVRRMGSAALNLCYLACGRMDAYWATSLKTWDVAAGALLVREAGGVITDLAGSTFDLTRPKLAAAATTTLHRELVDTLAAATPQD